MFAIVGAAGHVGSATSRALREARVSVRAILRDETKAAPLEEIGCEIALADLQDAEALARAIGDADAVQVVVPLRPQADDPAADLRRSIESLVEALAMARPPRVLAVSDYGAHVGHDIGMPSVFRDFEARLRRLECRKLILRSAEHMHNWGGIVPAALASGILPSFQDPVDMLQPAISAQDLGRISAALLLGSDIEGDVQVFHAEGPRRYSANDVAAALSRLSGRPVRAKAVPRPDWKIAFARMPASLADLLMKANDAKNKSGLVDVEPDSKALYGTTELIDALRPLLPLL